MAEDLTHRHIHRVLSVIQQGRRELVLEDSILRSWKRCLEGYTIKPAEQHQTLVIEHPRLVEHYQRMDSLLQIAGTEIEGLYRQISHSGYIIVLTDGEGIILNSVCDPVLRDDFMRAGLWRGAVWSEDYEGTNAIGTCLIEKLPLTVHLDEHYRVNNIKLTCSAAPIFDPYGELLAILDVSSVNSKDSKRSQSHTLALAGVSARLIENRYFLRQYSNQWVLRFSRQPEFVDLLGEGMIALDGDGVIVATNRGALDQLGLDGPSHLRKKPLGEVFAADLDALLGRARREQPNAVWPLRDRRGKQYFVTLRTPERPATSTHLKPDYSPTTTPLRQAARELAG